MAEQTKRTVIDLKMALATLKLRGINYNQGMVVEEFKVSAPVLNDWGKSAPMTVSLMNFCLKNSKKTFPEIMEGFKEKCSPDKALNFILDFCNTTGLTFKEVVKEV